jgi:anaerobic magnesium-protoporphyrin IX monomethyl ester cyclase
MKTLFVNPSLRPNAPHRQIPVGLGYVVTAVKLAGIPFDVLDIDIGRYSDSYVERYIIDHRYDVIALGSISTHYRWVKWFVNMVKSHQPDCTVIVGNSVGGSIPEVMFQHSGVDIIIKGEGDVTIVEVLRALNEGRDIGHIAEPIELVPHKNGNLPACFKGVGIEGAIFRDKNGRVIDNGPRKAVRDIDALPFPDWDIFDVDAYIKGSHYLARETYRFPRDKAVVFPVNTARGCIFKCTFCHYVFWHDPYRHRSAASVIGEIRHLQKKYGANYIEFWDELSFHKLKPTEDFVDALLAADLNIHWGAPIRSDLFGRDDLRLEDRLRVLQKMKDSGVLALAFSLESGNQEILDDMNKRIKVEYFDEQVRLLREVGIISDTSVVIGYPRETSETLSQTMEMCRRNRIYPSVGFLLPLPSTGMWDYALENGHITDIDDYLTTMTERQDLVLNLTKMSDEELLGETKGWLRKLNAEFGGALDEESLIKTGGYSKHNKHQDKELVWRNRLTKESLNIAQVEGTF